MKFWSTKVKAVCPVTGELTTFDGPNVPGMTVFAAQQYCNTNYLGYCTVDIQINVDKYKTGDEPCAVWCRDIDYDNIIKN